MTVGQFLERWLDDRVKPSVKRRAHENVGSVVRVRIVLRIGAHKLVELRPARKADPMSTSRKTGFAGRPQ